MTVEIVVHTWIPIFVQFIGNMCWIIRDNDSWSIANSWNF